MISFFAKMKSRVRQRAVRPGFARSVAILTSGTMLANALGVMTTPIVSRLYEPREFGEFAVISSVAVLLSALISVGLQSAIVKAASDEEGRRILSVALVAAASLATIITGVVCLAGPLVRVLDTDLPYAVAGLLVWAIGLLTSANGSLRSYVNRRGRNRVLFANSLIGAMSTLVITVPLGFTGAGSLGLIAGALGALVVSNAQMIIRTRPFGRRPSLADVREVLRENKDFVVFQYPANLVETVSAQAPRQALSLLFGSAAVGLYAMTDKMLGIPLRLIGAPIGTVYFRDAAQRARAGENLAPFTMKLVIAIMVAAYLPVLAVVLWGEEVFGWLLGAEWAGAGALASILIVQYVFALTRTCVGTARVVLGRQSVNLAMSGTRLVVELGALVVGSLVTGEVFGTLVCFSIASTLFYLFDMTITFRLLGRWHWRYFAAALAYWISIACFWGLGVAL